MRNRYKLLKRVGFFLFAPILFLVLGYSLMYVIGRPVIQFVSSSLDLFLLSEAPVFDHQPAQAFGAVENQEVKTDEQNELPSSQITYPKGGTQYGQIVIDTLQIDEPLYFGDTPEILRQGAGQFMGSVYPGELGTSLIGGHNSSSFGKLLGIQKGTKITVKTTYGNYVYQVTQEEIKDKNDLEIQKRINQRKERLLILYTCYPIDSLGMTDDRVFVTGKMIQGSIINSEK